MAERCPCIGLCGRAAAANSHHAQVDRPHPLVADAVNRPDFLTVEHDAEMILVRIKGRLRIEGRAIGESERSGHASV